MVENLLGKGDRWGRAMVTDMGMDCVGQAVRDGEAEWDDEGGMPATVQYVPKSKSGTVTRTGDVK